MDKEETPVEIVGRLVLQLNLVIAQPAGAYGRNYIRATAAANAMAYHTSHMDKKDLRNFEWTIKPLVTLLIVDIEDPVATKSALALRTLMTSRVCMTRLLEEDGLANISKTLDILMNKYTSELSSPTQVRMLVEHLAVCYREIARFYPWELVNIGALRHCVLMLRFGDVVLRTASCATLASLSKDLEICKQMFSYGAIKPLLTVSDSKVTNDACMLAGLGCIVQLCRIKEIANRMLQLGVVPVLEKALHKHEGFSHQAIREKSLYALGFLSMLENLKAGLCTNVILKGLRHEFHHGTVGEQGTILQFLMNVHKRYKQEREVVLDLRDDVLKLIKSGPWHSRNLVIKSVCVVYGELEDKWYMTEHGLVEAVIDVIEAKTMDLQEAPMVLFLHLSTHPDIPERLLEKGVANVAGRLVFCEDPIIRELAILLLRVLFVYDSEIVTAAVPENKRYLLKRDEYNPQVYGAEYGDLIEEYLQHIVENRRNQGYLVQGNPSQIVEELNITQDELETFQNTFMELDAECRGFLGIDEMKILIVLMGEILDAEEIDLLLKEYDTDHSGNLDFKEFVIMMLDWDRRFGTGMKRTVNNFIKRGAIGKAMRKFKLWWDKDKVEAAQIQQIKQRKQKQETGFKSHQLKYFAHEQLAVVRARELKAREMGLKFTHTGERLPSISPKQNNTSY